jgi:dnd system-associated protein 4
MNNIENTKIDWRNRNVYRDRKHEHLVKFLVEDKDTAIFDFNKELMVFAAMVGYCFNVKKHLSSDKIQISLGTYASSEDDGFIYLLALMEQRDAICLKESHIQDSIKFFEEYCNGGLDLINDWFNTSKGRADLLKLDTLEEKLLEQLNINSSLGSSSDLDVDF